MTDAIVAGCLAFCLFAIVSVVLIIRMRRRGL